jgi:hypothetical protein
MTLSINEWRAQAEFWAPTEKCSGLIGSIGLCSAVKHLSVCAGERFEASPQHPVSGPPPERPSGTGTGQPWAFVRKLGGRFEKQNFRLTFAETNPAILSTHP